MFAMGNIDYADAQRQSSVALEYLCRNYPIVDEHVKEAMGDDLYNLFIVSILKCMNWYMFFFLHLKLHYIA